MEEKKEWLEKVLDDASADVKSWPPWMKEGEKGKRGEDVQPQEAGLKSEPNEHKAKAAHGG